MSYGFHRTFFDTMDEDGYYVGLVIEYMWDGHDMQLGNVLYVL